MFAPIVFTGIKSDVTNLITSDAEIEYINFHLYPSAVVKILVDVPVGITVEFAPPLFEITLYTL